MDSEKQVFFRECQKFSRWVMLPILLSPAIVATILVSRVREDGFEGDTTGGLAAALAVTSAVALLFMFLKLVTEVRSDGVYIRFYPIHLRFKRFAFDEIRVYYARRCKPLQEYGGWGIRNGKAGKAYNVRGDMGLQLEMNDNKKILIGSQKAEQLAAAISKAIQ
jgi:hypothetical protein